MTGPRSPRDPLRAPPTPLTAAERQLSHAIRRRLECDLPGQPAPRSAPDHPSDDTEIRSEFLEQLLVTLALPIHLSGAYVTGALDLSIPPGALDFTHCTFGDPLTATSTRFKHQVTFARCHFLSPVAITKSVFESNFSCENSNFRHSASWTGTQFRGTTSFASTKFANFVKFESTVFHDDARLAGAGFLFASSFTHATFLAKANFGGTRFDADTDFSDSTFVGRAKFSQAVAARANFSKVKFYGSSTFENAHFRADANFYQTQFHGGVDFRRSSYCGAVSFTDANFFGAATFARAAFTKNAQFVTATFSGELDLTGVTAACKIVLSRTTISGPVTLKDAHAVEFDFTSAQLAEISDSAGLCARILRFTGVELSRQSNLNINTDIALMRRFHSAAPLQITVGVGEIDLANATLSAGTRIDRGSKMAHESLRRYVHRLPKVQGLTAEEDAALKAIATDLYPTLQGMLDADKQSIKSLAQCTTAEVTISISLAKCSFEDAKDVDKLSVPDVSIFPDLREIYRPHRFSRIYTNRKCIYDEKRARENRSRQELSLATADSYRGLRKGLEDRKNNDGAADFYYGEMEMRRLSARSSRRLPTVEWGLLTAYWALAGYGLRAWRSLAALAIIIAAATLVFSRGYWLRISGDSTHLIDPHSWAFPFVFAMQETVSFARVGGNPGVTLVGFGIVVDVALRIAGPVLIAFTVLAIRNRTKR